MDELRSIRTFLAVVREGSFSEAARRLDTTPATVTRAVADLEKRLNTQLLVRTTRRVSLSNDGAAYAARVLPLLDEFDAAADDMKAQSADCSGRLKLNAPMSFGLKVLPKLLQEFQKEAPKVDLAVTLQDRLVDMVSGDFDIAIRISEPPTDKSTIWRKICAVDRYFVTSARGVYADATSPTQLNGRDCFGFDADGGQEIWEVSRAGERHQIAAGTAVSSNNGDLLVSLITEGNGVALLPAFIVNDALARGDLVRLFPDWRVQELWLSLLYPPYETLPPRVAKFASFFENKIWSALNQ